MCACYEKRFSERVCVLLYLHSPTVRSIRDFAVKDACVRVQTRGLASQAKRSLVDPKPSRLLPSRRLTPSLLVQTCLIVILPPFLPKFKQADFLRLAPRPTFCNERQNLALRRPANELRQNDITAAMKHSCRGWEKADGGRARWRQCCTCER